MRLSYVDLLSPDQLMEGDLIDVDNYLVSVVSVVEDKTGDNYTVTYLNDFDEKEEKTYHHEEKINLYAFVEED